MKRLWHFLYMHHTCIIINPNLVGILSIFIIISSAYWFIQKDRSPVDFRPPRPVFCSNHPHRLRTQLFQKLLVRYLIWTEVKVLESMTTLKFVFLTCCSMGGMKHVSYHSFLPSHAIPIAPSKPLHLTIPHH